MISKLQYISQGSSENQHLANIQKACDLGVNWVQLRLKNSSQEKLLKTAIAAKEICEKAGAKFIINDHVLLAKEMDADGVHIGKNDLSPYEARKIMGPDKIIGVTANTLEDCLEHQGTSINYIGLGPFRFTNTKQNLSPILGLNGYKSIVEDLEKASLKIPIIAIGGIGKSDIKILTKTKIHGIAVSGMLSGIELGKEDVLEIKALLND